MSCNARCHHIVCVVQGRLFHATPNVADRVCSPRAVMSCHARRCRLFVLSEGGDVTTSSYRVRCPRAVISCHADVADRVCCPRAVMSCHTRRCRTCLLSKGGDITPHPTSSDCAVQSKGGDVIPRLMLFDRLCCPKAMMACHTRRHSTVCAAQRR